MPIYEYRCKECGQVFEEWQRDFKCREMTCPVCKGESERIMSNTSFVLKGGGWYVTDYCQNGASASAAGEPGKASASGEGASEAPASGGSDAAAPSAPSGSSAPSAPSGGCAGCAKSGPVAH